MSTNIYYQPCEQNYYCLIKHSISELLCSGFIDIELLQNEVLNGSCRNSLVEISVDN